MRWLRMLLLTFLTLWANVGLAGATAAQSSELVFAQRGTMPLLITAPHGGNAQVPGVPQRSGGNILQDARTRELTLALSAGIEAAVCQTPYVVLAGFHRRYIDANRPADKAYEHPDAAPHYAAYHESVRGFIDEIRGQFTEGAILIDIHGQSQDPLRIHRGTRNGLSVARLLSRHGDGALMGPDSIFGRLTSSGYDVFPPNTPLRNPVEDSRWDGAYSVTNYGSQNTGGIDTIQIEIGASFRQDGTIDAFTNDLTKAIAAFYVTYVDAQSHCS